jgi:hypothetical protein
MNRFFKRSEWDIRDVAAPWGPRPSIYEHIRAHLQTDKPGLKEGGETLPDEDMQTNEGLRWAPGALDGVFGHHSSPGEATQLAGDVLKALQASTEKATAQRARALYSVLTKHSTLAYIDPLLEAIVNANKINPDRLRAVARWLATGSPDREPVKTSIAILGLSGGNEDRDLLLTLGRHDEFTLYVAVALQNSEEQPEHLLWELGTSVTGWGRIHIVEKLAGTEDERIKAWLLREGYRNAILLEYTALICARTGGLLEALRQSEPDDQLLKSAGEILSALICGRDGPAEGMEAYPEGAEAVDWYLRHLRTRELDLEHFNHAGTVSRFLKEAEGEAHDMALGWPLRRKVLLDHINAIRSRPGWDERVYKGLASEDRDEFSRATEAAESLGIDTWNPYFERLQRGEDQWYFVMQTDDPDRIDKVVQLAEDRLPLAEIASGPAEELGLDPKFQAHNALDFVLQDLRRFPGKGWPLIRTGLQSPVTRNRNMAICAFSSWSREAWPTEAEFLLRRALDREPDEDTQELIRKLLAGDKQINESR